MQAMSPSSSATIHRASTVHFTSSFETPRQEEGDDDDNDDKELLSSLFSTGEWLCDTELVWDLGGVSPMDEQATTVLDPSTFCKSTTRQQQQLPTDLSAAGESQNDEASPHYEPLSHEQSAPKVRTQTDDDEEEDILDEAREETLLPSYLKDAALEELEKNVSNLCLDDIEKGAFEVHGIAHRLEENELLQARALQEMDQRLQQQKLCYSKGYRLAIEQDAAFCRSLHLAFLRAEEFSVPSATKRMMEHFDIKLLLWGKSKLTKHLTIEDLTPSDRETLEHGGLQLLPMRDHAGRAILFNNMNQIKYQVGMNQMRVIWFLTHAAAQDEQVQKNGMVVVFYKMGERKGLAPKRQLVWQGARLSLGVSVRLESVHACFNRSSLPWLRIVNFFSSISLRRKLRAHEARSHKEMLSILATFGVPREVVPVSDEGVLLRERHLAWLEQQTCDAVGRKEPLEKPNSAIFTSSVMPSNKDVFLGRGKRSQYHPGNLSLNILLEARLEQYGQAHRGDKEAVAASLLADLQRRGTRFLKPNQHDGWDVAEDTVAIKKICHDFRTIRQRIRKHQFGSAKNQAVDRPLRTDTTASVTGAKRLRRET